MEFRKTSSCGKSPMNSNQSPEFWGLEVEAHKSLTVKPDQDFFIYISRATLDKGKNGESALLFATVDEKKLVIGTLTQGNTPQISLDLFFEKEFKLSHNYDSGSVYFIGYQSPIIEQVEGDHSFGNSGALAVNPDSEKGMEMGKFDYVDEEEESLKQLEPSNKKRANESAPKMPLSAKKAKLAATPQRTGKNVLVHCSESKANLKKKNIHKEKSEETDEDEKIVSRNEIKEMKKSIKELSDAMKKLQQSQTTKAGLLEVLLKRYHEELKMELKGSAVDAAPVVEESVPDAAYTQSAEDDLLEVIMSNRYRKKLYNMKNEAVVTIKQRKPKLNAAQQ